MRKASNILAICLLLGGLLPAVASAADSPAWQPTLSVQFDEGYCEYVVEPDPAIPSYPSRTACCDTVYAGQTSGTCLATNAELYPLPADVRKCQETIAKVGFDYFAQRYKLLSKCRSSLMKGKAVFEDQLGITAVTEASGCPNEFKTAAKIAKAREKARLLVAKKCTDATLSDLASCGRTVDELIDSGLSSGCLIESVDDNVERVFADGFGY
jgi:hypothetical protein